MPFKPKGDTAQWRIVYDLFTRTPVDQILTYESLGEALDIDPVTGRARIQAAARAASKHLLAQDNRAVEVITDTGYRLVHASRQIPLAGKHVTKASNALDRGRSLTSHVRLDELSETERQVVHSMSIGFSQVAEWARQITGRVESHEGRLADIEAELARIKDQKADQG